MRKHRLKSLLRRKYRQTGSSALAVDKKLKAKKVGWRRSASGRIYYEIRRNRSDVNKALRL